MVFFTLANKICFAPRLYKQPLVIKNPEHKRKEGTPGGIEVYLAVNLGGLKLFGF